jgi:hypothetical protein
MATTRSFSTMLNEYLPNSLLQEELIKRDWLLTNIEKDNNWLGGDLIVPFIGAGASSVEFGALASSTDVSEDAMVRGKIVGYAEAWGTMLFNDTDLMQHGKLSEQNFLKILPDRVEAFMEYMKEVVSVNLLSGGSFAKVTADTNLGAGIVSVDHIDRFKLGQKVSLDDDDSSPTSYYVIAIDVNAGSGTNNTGTVTLSATRGGAAASLASYTLAQNSKFYHPGSQTAGFNSIRGALLSSANGGDSTVLGQTKTSYPHLQAVNVSGATINATNILDKLLDFYTEVRRRGKGNAKKLVMSYKHLGSILKLIETQKGGYKVTPTGNKASLYCWDEIEITTVRGVLTLVGIQEMDDDVIYALDMNAFTFYSNGFFKKRMSPEGKEFFEVRATTGFSYLVDISCFGNLAVKAPGHCGVLYSISY